MPANHLLNRQLALHRRTLPRPVDAGAHAPPTQVHGGGAAREAGPTWPALVGLAIILDVRQGHVQRLQRHGQACERGSLRERILG